MHLKTPFQHFLVLILFLQCISLSWSDTANQKIQYSEIPSWVKHYPVNFNTAVPLSDIEEGVYFRVVESQVRHIKKTPYELFVRRALGVISAQGMEFSSSFNIDFDPTYQTVELHEIKIIRDQKMIDKTPSARISVIQREERMEALIYDGRLTANVIIDDVRVGDVVEYAYSIVGRNPIYGDSLSLSRQTNYSVPVQQLNFRILTDKDTYFQSKSINTGLKVVEKELGQFVEYSIRDKNIQPLRHEANTPKWFDPYGQIYLTELSGWSDVIDWALPLYEKVITTNEEVNNIADDIKSKNKETGDQISAALQFVQNEIRYLGIENGLNSHMPSPVSETLERRYGDCKDKAVLFISVLKALGIKAFPALVNTTSGAVLNTLLPSNNIFDHVIVKVFDGKTSYWLDPTNRYQVGSMDNISESRFGYSLVVKPGVSELEDMNDNRIRATGNIHEKFNLLGETSSPVKYSIESQYSEKLAEHTRYDLVINGIAGTQKKYVDYYKTYYPGITVDEQLSSETSEDNISIKERYLIADFWENSDSQKGHLGYFYANYILSVLIREVSNERDSPYYIGGIKEISQTIDVAFPDEGWKFDDTYVVENNDVFDFEYQVEFNSDTLVLTLKYHLNLKKEFVSSENYPEYIKNREKVVDLLSYEIIKYYETSSTSLDQVNWSQRLMYFFIGYVLLSFMLLIATWLFERKNRPEDDGVKFFPVSLERFYIFSIMTFNLYTVYWTYKNWKYIKTHKNSSIMPIGRTIFHTLWFYSFNRYFKLDSEERFEKNKVYSNPTASILLILYFITSVAQSGAAYIFSILVLPLFFVKYVNYINLINNKDGSLYRYNTSWSWKHIPTILFFAPLLMVSVLGHLYLIPSSDIEKGSRIWSHDLRFMKREGVISVSEDIQYFFSNDFWSIRADGNGFTENRVFSYWNENDQLSVEKANYDNIKAIDPQYGNNYLDDTVVTISRFDDTTFLLFLSGDKLKDKVFVTKMMEYWELSKVK